MSWAKINTYNLLDRFQIRTRQEPYKFHQIDSGFNDYSESIWIQDERDELNYQIKTMFDEMREWLGFYPRPIWKKIRIPLDSYQTYYAQDYLEIPESAWLLGFGTRNTELIQSGVAIASKPTNSDYVSLTITTSEITDGELCLFHTSDDAFGNTADDRFRIYQDNVYYDGTSYQVKVHYSRLIKPVLWQDQFVNGDYKDRKEYTKNDTSNYVSEIDVYRVYNDTSTNGRLIGSPYDFSGLTTTQTSEVDLILLDSENSYFKIVGDGSYPTTFEPNLIEVDAYIGYPLTEQNATYPIIEEFIIRKSKVEMGMNARLASAKISTQWDYDDLPAYTKPDANSGRTGIGAVGNPVGLRNVDVEMFRKLMPIANYRGKILDKRFWIR